MSARERFLFQTVRRCLRLTHGKRRAGHIGYLNLYFRLKADLEPKLLALLQSVLMRLACQLPHASVIAPNVRKAPFHGDSPASTAHNEDRQNSGKLFWL
jgi:hypothetical protein